LTRDGSNRTLVERTREGLVELCDVRHDDGCYA
jgi:hypothetical protein